MKRILIVPFAAAVVLSAWLIGPPSALAQKGPAKYPTMKEQLSKQHMGEAVDPATPLAELIARNQEFSMLRADEFGDRRGLPPWLRVWWRKAHPEGKYSPDDPTKGYPLVLKEVLEWMVSHQDLKPGPGINEATGQASSPFIDSLIGGNVRTSGLQAAARSESYIQINFFNPLQILVASNNISASGLQGIYRSMDGGVNWSQTTLPLAVGDSFHSDPTVDFANDGRFYSSTLGINGNILKLRNYVSMDSGATWTNDATPSGSQTAVDKQIMWVDKSPTSPFFGQIYAIWHNNDPAYMNRRTAGSAGTWLSAPVQVSGAESVGTAIGGDVKTNSAGDVFGFWPTTSSSKIFMTKSTDGGTTFSTPVQVAATKDTYDISVPAFSSRRALVYVSSGAYKTVSKDNVYVTWTDLSGETGCTTPTNEPGTNVASPCKTRIWFARSTNGGAAWSAPVMINNQAGLNDQFNQWLAVDDTTGNIGVMYYDTAGDAGRKKTDVWFQKSFDDGASWSTAEKISTAMTDETISGADSGNQYGDYNGLSGYANSFFPSWTDRRNGLKEEIWTALISVGPPPPPSAVVTSTGVLYISESGTPSNNVPDPGETFTVSLGLQNTGNADSGAVTATLQGTGGVTSPSALQNYGSLIQGGPSVNRNFSFIVDPASVCGGSITLTFSVQDGAKTPTLVTKSYSLGTPVITLAQNFDSVAAPTLPSGWSTTQDNSTSGITWTTSSAGPNSAPNSAFAGDPAAVSISSLISPAVAITSANSQVKFKNKYVTESTYDGMVLEVTTNGGGTWTDIVTAGGVFVTGGYNAAISTAYSSPIAGRQAWTGTSGGYIDTLVSLPASMNGQTIQLRWRMASDASVGATGVNVDDVQILGGSACATVGGSIKSRADFDGDGKTDLSVFRPSDGNWYLNRSTAGFTAVKWGLSGDVPVPGDYDGDGKSDLAVFRASDVLNVPDFYILTSGSFVFNAYSYGSTGDIPVAGDFDGDGKSDIVVFRPSIGAWFLFESSTQSSRAALFGAVGDIPVAMDNDGDGKSNLAVFRPSNNTWYIARPTGVPAQNFDAVPFGTAGDVIVPADYDGDNKDDIAVFRPSEGNWYILRSTNGSLMAIHFGASGDIAVPGDYDGDGKDDVAVYRNGVWYINGSTSGFSAVSFGLATDVPIPAKYRP